ncbi:MAG: hypothetical protein AAB495_02215 [Patescibacteria group bacterium]
MQINDRTADILEAAIREFIETGEPISSGFLYDAYSFGIKPAMIRAELARLTADGFLEQPYHSAGRIPTDQGYEFFASRTIDRGVRERAPKNTLSEPFRAGAWCEFLGEFSDLLGVAAIAEDLSEKTVHKEGLSDLIQNLSWDSRESLQQVIEDFEEIDRRLNRIEGIIKAKGPPQVFVGKKSPITESDDIALIAGGYDIGGRKIMLILMGPKRMDYEKAAEVLRGLERVCDTRHRENKKKIKSP